MGKTIQIQAEVKVPTVPNFLIYPAGTISIADITDDGLKKIGEAWTQNLIVKADEIRKAQEISDGNKD